MRNGDMVVCEMLPEFMKRKLIEIVIEPELSKLKPVVNLREDEVIKLLSQIELTKKPWLAMNFKEKIYVIWNGQIFQYSQTPKGDSSQNVGR